MDILDNLHVEAVETRRFGGEANTLAYITGNLLEVDLIFSDSGLTEKHNLNR